MAAHHIDKDWKLNIPQRMLKKAREDLDASIFKQKIAPIIMDLKSKDIALMGYDGTFNTHSVIGIIESLYWDFS